MTRSARIAPILLGLAALSVATPARAKRPAELPPDPRTDAGALLEPTVRAVAFVDSGPDCDPVEAWYGRCVERVELYDPSAAWSGGGEALDRALWRNFGELYASLWEDVAVRWTVDDDVLSTTLIAAKVARLPDAATLWDASLRAKGGSYSLPDRALWLEDPTWRSPASEGQEPWFRDLAFAYAAGLPAPPRVALLRGRFATRLAYDGRRHPYDIMDGDPRASGPFHEQMYPFRTALESGDASLQPLRHFVVPEAMEREDLDPFAPDIVEARREIFASVSFPEAEGPAAARALAEQEFDRFFDLVGTQIVRFTLEEFTPTHMRVLAALLAMDTPPGRLDDGSVARDVVAASEGQTDDEMLIQSLVEPEQVASDVRFAIDFSKLPDAVVDRWLDRFPERASPPESLLLALNKDVDMVLTELLRPSAPPLKKLDAASMNAWVEAAALPGRTPDVDRHLRRLTLRALVESQPPMARDEAETRILLDHAELDITGRFDTTRGYRATPQELETTTASRWRGVLRQHGLAPRPIADGPGAVDPIAICTTLNRKDALSEPVFGVVDLDLLLVAPDGLADADAVLWAARAGAPFVMVDDPASSIPVATRLVGLPEDQAIYRVRWTLWAGWHMLWAVESLAPGDPQSRLALRTGAVCEDTVLSDPALIPTLARAALLDGELRSATPLPHLSRRERKAILAAEGRREEAPPPGLPETPDRVAYIQDLMRKPLIGQAEAPITLVVFSSRLRTDGEPAWRLRPKTPYARRRAKLGGKRVTTSAWILSFEQEVTPAVALIAPAYQPSASVSAGSPSARWRRPTQLEFALDGSLAAFPLRDTRYGCPADAETLDAVNVLSTVAPCTVDSPLETSDSSGILLDLSAPVALWVIDEPRVGLELGPQLQLAMLPRSAGDLWPQGGPAYTRTRAARAGLVVGVRVAPDPLHLRRFGPRPPWGADGPDGQSQLGRAQMGLRVGGLVGPGFNGAELTGTAELWTGFAIRNPRAPSASFTPWHPVFLLGPYVSGQSTTLLAPGEEPRYYVLDRRNELTVGLRGQIRLSERPGAPPEVE